MQIVHQDKNFTARDMPIHELTLISVCLTCVGGFLDAYTYIYRGGVFANAQTGNFVLLGISVAQGSFKKALFYFIPIMAFAVGIFVTEVFKRRFSDSEFDSWQHISLVIELLLLFTVGFVPNSFPNVAVNVTVSFVCSLQVNSFRKIMGAPYSSTMCTGNLRSATEQLCIFLFEKNSQAGRKCARYIAVIAAFCTGAVLGTVLTRAFAGGSIWFCCVILLAVLCAVVRDKTKYSQKC